MIENVISGLKTLLAEFAPVDAGEFKEDLNPRGSVAIQITNMNPVQANVPDWILDIDFMGLTTADADPDKTLITRLYDGVFRTLARLTKEQIATATGEKASLWIPTSAVAPSGNDGRIFTITYRLIIQDFNQ